MRYKDFALVCKPALVTREDGEEREGFRREGFVVTESTRDFGVEMRRRGVQGWWRRGMGWVGGEGGLG